jgi:hypothetical protein
MKLLKTSAAIAILLLLATTTAVFAQSVVSLRVNNNTPLVINIYIDGNYAGQLDAFSYSYANVTYGDHTLYAKAPSTNIVWGPTDIYDDGFYTWNLDP